MSYNKPLQDCTAGDYFQLIDGKLFLKITGGEYPKFEGYLVDDPSGWIGNDKLYKGGKSGGLVNIAQRQMGPYAESVENPQNMEQWLDKRKLKLVDGVFVTA